MASGLRSGKTSNQHGRTPGREGNARLKQRIETPFSHIRGCVWQGDDRIIVCDEIKRQIATVDVNRKYVSENVFTCPSLPVCMAKIDNSQFAVALSDSNTILVMNAVEDTPNIVTELATSCQPWGLAYNDVDAHLVVQSRDGSITFLRLDGSHAGSVPLSGDVKETVKATTYIAFCSTTKTCYLSCTRLNKIIALNLNGQTLFNYTHSNLKYPWGISIFSDGDIFVCSYWGNCMQQVCSSGELVRELLTTENDLRGPSGIALDDTMSHFVIGYYGKMDICVYEFL